MVRGGLRSDWEIELGQFDEHEEIQSTWLGASLKIRQLEPVRIPPAILKNKPDDDAASFRTRPWIIYDGDVGRGERDRFGDLP